MLLFLVMLGVGVCTTVGLVLKHGERLQYAELGPDFYGWYLGILLAAICLSVPVALFQSVQAEFDGQTFEMLAISALTPREIVFGKLKSAILQMGLFYAAAAPFLCLTYLLEGINLPGIALGLIISFVAGLSSCLGAMMLASIAKQSAWSALALVVLVALNLLMFGLGLTAGQRVAVDLTGWSSVAEVCAGVGCFGYVFVFYSLVTVGISIAQFTTTIRPPGPEAQLSPASRAGMYSSAPRPSQEPPS